MHPNSRPRSLSSIRTWEEGIVVSENDRLYAQDASGRRFRIAKRDAVGLSEGDVIMFVPGRTTALKIAPC